MIRLWTLFLVVVTVGCKDSTPDPTLSDGVSSPKVSTAPVNPVETNEKEENILQLEPSKDPLLADTNESHNCSSNQDMINGVTTSFESCVCSDGRAVESASECYVSGVVPETPVVNGLGFPTNPDFPAFGPAVDPGFPADIPDFSPPSVPTFPGDGSDSGHNCSSSTNTVDGVTTSSSTCTCSDGRTVETESQCY